MINCSNCGQVNATESNFCRFCGTKMFPQRQSNPPLFPPAENHDFEYSPPRAHVWKTDEFQVPDKRPEKPRPVKQVNRVQPLPHMNGSPQTHPAPMTEYRPANIAYGYRCPRCATQLLPKIERKISSAGWVVFAVLLVMFFPLFWVGFLIKEDVRICPVCNLRIS